MDVKFNVGAVNHCNFVDNVDDDNTLIFADIAEISVINCHFSNNKYGIYYALWSFNSIMKLNGNHYDSLNLCGTASGGTYQDEGDNVKDESQSLENFPHYANNYCEAKNRYPPTPDFTPVESPYITPFTTPFTTPFDTPYKTPNTTP